MKIQPKLGAYQYMIKTIDSHTMGEPTRIIYDGFPDLQGNTMMEKKKYLTNNYDYLRSALMLEPRGHRDLFGAILTKPVDDKADCGVIFTDSAGCLNMCGHGSIGVASMLVETGIVNAVEPYTQVILDTPSGVIRTKVHVENKKAVEVSILNVPAFLYKKDQSIKIDDWGTIKYDISFGGSFFALINSDEIGLNLETENVNSIIELGMRLLEQINANQIIKHPYLDITTVDLIEFYGCTDSGKADMKNCVVFGDGQVDRSPCGTGTSAKLATLYTKGELSLNEEFIYESITGSVFRGKVIEEIELDGKLAIIPQITGSAYITGLNKWIIDAADPLAMGFLLGDRIEEEDNIREKIIKVAWELFAIKGYSDTCVEDIVEKAQISYEEFYKCFSEKDDLEETLGELFDQKYAQLMLYMDSHMSSYEKLLFLNQELFGLIQDKVPFNLIEHTYVSMHPKRHNMLNNNRLYYKLIPKIIIDGQRLKEFKKDESPESMADTYMSLERGLIYDWCIKNGEYSLKEKSKKLLPIYLNDFLLNGKREKK